MHDRAIEPLFYPAITMTREQFDWARWPGRMRWSVQSALASAGWTPWPRLRRYLPY